MGKLYKRSQLPDIGMYVDFEGSDMDIRISYMKPKYGKYTEPCFAYQGYRHYLSSFEKIDKSNCSDYLKEFDAILWDSAFSGLVVKVSSEGDTVKVYRFISKSELVDSKVLSVR